MKFVRYFIAAMLVLGLTGVANAFTFGVLDPSMMQTGSPDIYDLGTPIDFTFYACPSFLNPLDDPNMGCFSAVNYTPNPITTFSATLQLPSSYDPSAGYSCPTTSVGGLASFPDLDSCMVSGDSTSGYTMTVSFSGGDVPFSDSIVIVEDGIDPGDFSDNPDPGSFTVGSAPEPSSIWLALSGLGPLGYLVRRRRKSQAV